MTLVDLTTTWFHLHLQLSDAVLLGLWPLLHAAKGRAAKRRSTGTSPRSILGEEDHGAG
jgi:hypothetical protein